MGRLVIQSQAGVDDFDTFAFILNKTPLPVLPVQATTGAGNRFFRADIIDT
jgi:hypothetical protein